MNVINKPRAVFRWAAVIIIRAETRVFSRNYNETFRWWMWTVMQTRPSTSENSWTFESFIISWRICNRSGGFLLPSCKWYSIGFEKRYLKLYKFRHTNRTLFYPGETAGQRWCEIEERDNVSWRNSNRDDALWDGTIGLSPQLMCVFRRHRIMIFLFGF